MKPAPTTLREACEAEWQAQETALAQERAGLAPSGQPGIDMNRLLCRTLDQAPADVLPPDFATRLARQVASERSAGHVQGTGRFELLLAAGGLAARWVAPASGPGAVTPGGCRPRPCLAAAGGGRRCAGRFHAALERRMIALRRLLWACCLGLATPGVLAQTTAAPAVDRARLDAFMQALSRHDQALGSVAIALPGQPLYTRATGQASADATPLATPETRYRIGSISKLFTATLVMQQVQARRLSLDTRLSRFYPQLPNAERITIEQLLRHRSGLGDLKDAPDFEQRLARAPQDEATLLALIREAGTQFEPDTRSHYNNSGPILLGFILQRITGQTLRRPAREHIAEPLGLSNTFYSDTPDHGPQASQSLHWQSAWAATPATHPTVPQGSGAVVSTPSDLVRFIQALFAQRLVNADSLAQMSRLVDGFGLGLVRLPPADAPGLGRLRGYGHEGVIDAHSAVLMILPQQGVALAWCSNGARLPREAVVTALLRTVFEPGYRPPTFEPVTTNIDFALTLPPTPSTGAAPAIVSPGLRGSVPPLSWDTPPHCGSIRSMAAGRPASRSPCPKAPRSNTSTSTASSPGSARPTARSGPRPIGRNR
ncbi:MAG: beta-lactamase family protein [Ideonella sp.]|nr:beta-lactamase family protein [Ideonella sp.]